MTAASFFPSPAHYSHPREAAGFLVDSIALIPRPTPLSTGMETWLNILRNSVLDRLAPVDRTDAVARTVDLPRPILWDHDKNWSADYLRLRFLAIP